jgi:putative ABC transport system permease protein
VHSLVDIPWWRLSLAFACAAAVLALARHQRLEIERDILIASARGPIQLIAIAYVLTAIFAIDHPALVLLAVACMLAVATQTAVGRLRQRFVGLRRATAAALGIGTALSLVLMSGLIVQLKPWYAPQYVITFAGMILGNSMNAASLAGERFQEEVNARRDEIEARLALGFTGPQSVHPLLQRSLKAALMPTINSLMVAGVVQLPGMMTGQILSGVAPDRAVRYQILIYFLLLLSVCVSAWILLLLISRRYLTAAHQLRDPQGG